MLHKIKIEAVLNGYIANVGCQTLVFNSRPDMLKELDAYLEKPEETETRYSNTALNAKQLGRFAPEAAYATASGNTVTFTAPCYSIPATNPIR